jgi:hypothetical protein
MIQTEQVMLVTIIAERLIEGKLIELFHRIGIRGYSITDCRGDTNGSVRASEWEGDNIQIQLLLSMDRSEKLLTELKDKFIGTYAVVAYRAAVEVLRGEKFKA